ncbi:hypothetical protein SAMN05660733_07756 [Lentzea albidocapillata]|uniref:Uncharacterized protein n=1 Tax=Lentzea albidocapillata TaxID=40571 RepID=A0A1W2FSJ7_9PSEU|nr:hypothetical protein SAMN05660733_07756 [Lentzea albidocapillata]
MGSPNPAALNWLTRLHDGESMAFRCSSSEPLGAKTRTDGLTLCVPKITSTQAKRHADTRGGLTEAIPSEYREAFDPVRSEGLESGSQGCCGGEGSVGAVPVVVLLVRLQRVPEASFQISVRSKSSPRNVLTQRSMIAFMRGTRMPVKIAAIPAPPSIPSINAGYLPSRSRMRNLTRARLPASSRPTRKFRRACVTQACVGCAVAPRMRTRAAQTGCSVALSLSRPTEA